MVNALVTYVGDFRDDTESQICFLYLQDSLAFCLLPRFISYIRDSRTPTYHETVNDT